jgi:non-haem Fe2+, alpha-ketoglutarate-dependent halogenase
MPNQSWQDQRVLQFFPAENDAPRALTATQLASYNENGYIKPLEVFTEKEADENRRYFDRLLEETLKDGKNSYAINGYHTRCAPIWDIVTHPRILDYVEDILGSNFVAWGTHYFCKLPHDEKSVPWHQDASYWPLTPSKTVTVWLAIDDADRQNSAMKVISGSHRHGHLDFSTATPDEKVVLNQKVTDAENYGDVAYIELKAGQISLHSDLIVHGSDPNASARRRCGLTIRYAPVEVRTLQDWNNRSVWCRGEAPSGHWANIPRPFSD